MFTIQYQAIDGTHAMQDFDCNDRAKLLIHLSRFNRPIEAVYENASPVTKQMRKQLRDYLGSKSSFARDFSTSPR